MADEQTGSREVEEDQASEHLDQLEDIGKTVVRVAASAVVASSLASALAEPPHAEMMSLPEPVPIVRMYQAVDDDVLVDEEDEVDESESRWRRILRILKYLLVALALVGSILLGALKGCAGIAGGLMLPHDEEQQEQQREQESSHHSSATEDERGVATGVGV